MTEERYSDSDSARRDTRSFIEPRPPLIQNPFMRARPQKGINLLEIFEEDLEIEEPELVKVYLRMKPCIVPSRLYEVTSDKCLVTTLDTTTAGHGRRTQHNVSKMYTFSRIFDAKSTQKEIFDQVVKNNLKKLVDGESFTLLTYGASGSGKTYTLMGTVSSPGLVPRSLEYVFKLVDAVQMPTFKPSDTGANQLTNAQQDFELQWVKRLRHVSIPQRDKYRRMSTLMWNDATTSNLDLSNRTKYYVWVSFVEIYNECIYDLLATADKRVKMRIREDSSGNVYVKDLTQAFVRSGEEAYDVLVAGKHNLVVAATGVHAHSSRSHCIFTITLLTENGGEIRTSQVRLCDLAGCERQQATHNIGARMQESRAINSSLHVLERCLHMLRRKQKLLKESSLVPYRESKLTRLLGSGLSGSRGEAVSMVVTLNPAPQYAYETKHVLSLAVVAQDIQTNFPSQTFTTTLSSLESSTQNTTISDSFEIMKLRADNERLHYELAQAQAQITKLLESKNETHQQNSNAMRQMIQETKDMMSDFHESEIALLKKQMEYMKEEYEARLAGQPAAPAPGAGTPTRYLQSKVSELMTENVVLEEKLSEERLARERTEKELQHLRACIEERDEEAFKETPEHEEDVVIVDSENESEEDSSDPLDESLEPIFKMERINRSKNVCNEPSNNLETLNLENMDDTTHTTGDDKSEILDDENQVESTYNSITNYTQNISDINIKETINKEDNADSAINITHTDKDKSECEELFNESTKLRDQIPCELINQVIPSNLRGTYFVKNDEPQNEYIEENIVDIKKINPVRGTYFVRESDSFSFDKVDVDDTNTKDKHSEKNEITRSKKVSEILTSKIMKSLKTSQDSNSSLAQFERLEMAANDVNNFNYKTTDSVDLKTLNKKRNYFEDTINKVSNTAAVINKPTVSENVAVATVQYDDKLRNALVNVTKQVKSKYLEHKTNDDRLSYLSTAAKTQEKLLNCDDHHNNSHMLTSPKNLAKLTRFEIKTEISQSSNLSSAPEIQENVLQFHNNHKISYNDVILSRSSDKEICFKKNGVNVSESNKNIIDIITNSNNDENRSPSIVKDDIGNNYKPSRAVMKLLGESFTKPELLSSIHKNKEYAKKQESVDIFDSPQIHFAKAKEIIGDIVKISSNIENTEEIIETSPTIKVKKELSDVEIVTHSIEGIVLEQKTKADVKLEIKLETASPSENSVTDKKKSKSVSKESEVNNTIEIIPSSEQGPNDPQTSKENNTLNDFEDIYKDLTNPRTTDFELLVSQVDTSNVKEKTTNTVDTSNMKKKNHEEEVSEETKYNLRHKKNPTKTRRLRLRRMKNEDDESLDQDTESKLKDIIKLKKEFCDVTMDLPAIKIKVKDIPSPEKLSEEENLPPMVEEIQSCPSKILTRSRRKLFTPRAEPLEESLSPGNSNERLYVPRPSYHRTRSRRKL